MSNATFVILSLPSQRSSCGQGRSYYSKTCAESIWRCCLMNRKMSQAKISSHFCQLSRLHQSALLNKFTKIEPFAKNESLTFAGELANDFHKYK
jgi:hypothetical protein